MYQSYPAVSDRLIDVAIRTIAASGQTPPTARRIAASAGIAPSLINYRFGSVAALAEAAQATAQSQEALIWQQWRETYLPQGITRHDLAAILLALLEAESDTANPLPAMRWVRFAADVRAGIPSTLAGRPDAAEAEFWQCLMARAGLSAGEGSLAAAFFHGLAFGRMTCGWYSGFRPWSVALVTRFCDRLSGLVPLGAGDTVFRWEAADWHERTPLHDEKSAHETRRRIVDAAIRLMTDEGLGSLTYRRLAAAAGVSTSSILHFFQSRAALVNAAYCGLYERLRDRAMAALDAAAFRQGGLSATRIAASITPSDEAAAASMSRDLVGTLDLIFRASLEPDLRRIGLALFARSGEASQTLLALLAHPRGSFSRLDGQIFRLVSNGISMGKTAISGEERNQAGRANRSTELLLSLVFQMPEGARG